MFNELTLRGSVRWRAIRAFTEYLELYWESHRTPKDRARNLKHAETSLLRGDRRGRDVRPRLLQPRRHLLQARRDRARRGAGVRLRQQARRPGHRVPRAARRGAGRLQPRRHAQPRPRGGDLRARRPRVRTDPGRRRDRRSRQASSAAATACSSSTSGHAQAHDLKGMALLALGQPGQAERQPPQGRPALVAPPPSRRSSPSAPSRPPRDSALPGARANTRRGAAQPRRGPAQPRDRRLRAAPARARRPACTGAQRRLAPTETRAATLLARGQMLDDRGKPGKARDCYDAALKIDPENPVYWAHLASAYAAERQRDEGAPARRLRAQRAGADLPPDARAAHSERAAGDARQHARARCRGRTICSRRAPT